MDAGLVAVVAVVVVLGLVVLVGGAGLVIGLWLFVRRRGGGPDPMARQEALEALGFRAVKEHEWSRPIQGTTMVFVEEPETLRWSVRLPRYNTMTLHLEERSAGASVEGAFDCGDAELDERFVLGSTLAARTVALLENRQVKRALLAMPSLSLQLGADELILEDPGRVSMKEMGAGVDDELALHTLVGNVVNSIFGAMYTESGTVFDEYR